MQSSQLITPLAIQTPICVNGDKNIPSQSATGTDTSSINLGFLPITSQPLDENGKAPERIDFNGMFYLSTDQRVYLQNGGFITYNADVATAIGGYPKGAILGYMDTQDNYYQVQSLIEDNQYNFVTTPSYINNIYWAFVGVLKDLSNISSAITSIPPTALTNFDGQWTYKKRLVSTDTAYNSGTPYTYDLSSYLGVSSTSTVQYELLFAQSYYRDFSSSTWEHGLIYSDVINDYSTTEGSETFGSLYTSTYGRTTAYLGTIPLKTKLKLRFVDSGLTKHTLIAVGYRRLGTNQ